MTPAECLSYNTVANSRELMLRKIRIFYADSSGLGNLYFNWHLNNMNSWKPLNIYCTK